MSEQIKHECGLALIRLRKPLEFYVAKYHTPLYGLKKLYLLMEKQHNRGQDGAGVAVITLDPRPGHAFIHRERSNSSQPIADIFQNIFAPFRKLEESRPALLENVTWLKQNVRFVGELLLGHLRYGTHGKNNIEQCHPVLRTNNWMTRNLLLAGNFNMTNNDELFQQLLELGQHPKEDSDTVTVLEKIGHFLDTENQRLFEEFKSQGYTNREISDLIAEHLDLARVLSRSIKDFDGGYAMAGLIGHGDAFVMRDPNGIRPAFYYFDDEVAVVASERPAIQTCFSIPDVNHIHELQPGHALILKKNGLIREERISEPAPRKSCSFERIYFSRGTDKDIYTERKKLGYLLTDSVLKAVNYDFENTVFSCIPNTAEVAFIGLQNGLHEHLANYKKEQLRKIGLNGNTREEDIDRILRLTPRVEKLAIKDVKLRTFITEDNARKELVSHVYDVTYGLIRNNQDTIVALDDSIVRGTTLQQSILLNLDRLCPKKIIIVSSAPQIRYPDCYGIDMSRMNDFIAFRAAIALIEERNMEDLMDEIYERCKAQQHLPAHQVTNEVKKLYAPFSYEEISAKIAQLVRGDSIRAEVEVIYQTIENLHKACPNHTGDWYFSGDFPTPGGNKVVNRAFMNYMEGINERAY
ncbi:MAG: amidophosphoribosyltransferase [Chitinophagales bacterium]|nr:MAG: amidophosphoribosyltransferase [Chitinophagales bacterium]